MWQKNWGGNGNDIPEILIGTNDNGFVVAGSSLSTDIENMTNKGSNDAVIIKFDNDGNILNYEKLLESLRKKANKWANEARDEEVESIENLIDLIEKYDEVVKDTLPSLTLDWIEYNNEIKDLERSKLEAIANIEKQITDAISNELKKRTDETHFYCQYYCG